jgi:predicted ATPase
MGEFQPAREQVEIAIALYDPEIHRPLTSRYEDVDGGVLSLLYAGLTLWQLGYPSQVLKRSNEALALAQGLSHPRSLGWAESFIGMLRKYRREAGAAQEDAERVTTLSLELGYTDFLAWGTSLRGWAMAAQGRHEEGIAQIQEGLAQLRATGFEVARTYFLCSLAEACIEAGRLDDALSALTEAAAAANQREERQSEAEIFRLKGELLLRQDYSDTAEAQRCFWRAIEVARKQSAKSFELRATMSLARLLDKQGNRDEARAMLAEIYNWFTEGFDTADLIDAKALLGELSA